MNMFARFDENPAMTLWVINMHIWTCLQCLMKIQQWLFELLRKQSVTDGRTDGQHENSIPPTNKVCGGYNYWYVNTRKRVSCIQWVNRAWAFVWANPVYSNTCVKGPLSKRPKIGFQDCRSKVLRNACSTILWTFIKLPIVIKIFVLSIFEWPFYTRFTVLAFRKYT